jgi:alanine racemase
VPAGESIGYNASFVAPTHMKVAVLNIGYADGYWRALARKGAAYFQDQPLQIVGRISMDLIAIDVTAVASLKEGDWVDLDFNLEQLASESGMSQYELLTGLGHRFERYWS